MHWLFIYYLKRNCSLTIILKDRLELDLLQKSNFTKIPPRCIVFLKNLSYLDW